MSLTERAEQNVTEVKVDKHEHAQNCSLAHTRKDVRAQTSTDRDFPKYDQSGAGPNTALIKMNK